MERLTAPNRFMKWLCLLTIPAGLVYFAHVFIGAQSYPGYDWMSQAVSDLTAADSPVARELSGHTAVYGVLSCVGCLFVSLTMVRESSKPLRVGIRVYTVMNWISSIGYALFPLSGSGYHGLFQDFMHLYVVTGGVVLSSIVSLVLIAVGGLRKPRHAWIAIAAIVAFVCMMFGAAAIGAFPKEYFGLVERFSVFSVVIFSMFLGLWGFSSSTKSNTAQSSL